MRFVLVDDSDVPVSPAEATTCVQERGLKGAAEFYGLSVSTLRNFLKRNGVVSRTTVVYEQVPQVPVPAGDEDVPF